MTMQGGLIFEQGRAIGADRFGLVTHIDENMRMIEGRQRADAHEFLGPNAHDGHTRLVVEMGRGMFGHGLGIRASGWVLDRSWMPRTISEASRLG